MYIPSWIGSLPVEWAPTFKIKKENEKKEKGEGTRLTVGRAPTGRRGPFLPSCAEHALRKFATKNARKCPAERHDHMTMFIPWIFLCEISYSQENYSFRFRWDLYTNFTWTPICITIFGGKIKGGKKRTVRTGNGQGRSSSAGPSPSALGLQLIVSIWSRGPF